MLYTIFLQIIFLTYVEQQFKYFQYTLYSLQLNIKPTQTETQERVSTHFYIYMLLVPLLSSSHDARSRTQKGSHSFKHPALL